MTEEHESPSAPEELHAAAQSRSDPASLARLGAGRSVWRQAAEHAPAAAAGGPSAGTADGAAAAIARSLIGPLQLAWLRAAQTPAPRSPVIGRRPSYDDCE